MITTTARRISGWAGISMELENVCRHISWRSGIVTLKNDPGHCGEVWKDDMLDRD